MSDLLEEVGKRIRMLRKSKGLTQEQLAGKASLDYKFLGSVERGQKNISVESLGKLARALGIEPLQFFLFTSPAPEKPERIAEAKVLDGLRRSDPRMREAILRILGEMLRVGRGE